MLGFLVAVLAALGAGAIVVSASHASLSPDSNALGQVTLPLGGGKIESVSAFAEPRHTPVPVELQGRQVWPLRPIPAGERLSIDVVVRRPGWIAWLTGSTERVQLTLSTPVAQVLGHYLTVNRRHPLRVPFSAPVSVVFYGQPGKLSRHLLPSPQSLVLVPTHRQAAGTIWLAGVPRPWESAPATMISWFPGGIKAAVVATPAPATQIKPGTPITLTFSKPLARVLGSSRPAVVPTTPGAWHTVNSHTITFQPQGLGYGLGAHVRIALPAGVELVGAQGASAAGEWSVPVGSTLRLQQLLATLGYLPLTFTPKGAAPPPTLTGQYDAAASPPAGTFNWRYGNVPDGLRSLWAPGASGVMTRGAVMAFENDQGLVPDGAPGPQVWKALIGAVMGGHTSSVGYTFADVSEGSPETLHLWHNGQTVVTALVNTGISAAPTATGTYPVFEHLSSGTMSGTNPNGSHYKDPGIPWISYFNGGDALHGFIRPGYGYPQSLGCVEMSFADAGKVWPYTPIGTLVNVHA